MIWFWLLLALLVLIAGLVYRRRVTRFERRITDDMLRQIENRGRVEMDEPLDLDEIQEEERRFWEETWDEPEQL